MPLVFSLVSPQWFVSCCANDNPLFIRVCNLLAEDAPAPPEAEAPAAEEATPVAEEAATEAEPGKHTFHGARLLCVVLSWLRLPVVVLLTSSCFCYEWPLCGVRRDCSGGR